MTRSSPAATHHRLSVVIPALNEADSLPETLSHLQSLRARGHQVILVDAGSTDATVRLATGRVDVVAQARTGRADQMNAGAALASGTVLLFVHADTWLPEGSDELVLSSLKAHGRRWGRFDVRLSGRMRSLRVIETLMNLRSRWSGIATGDQAMFVERSLFDEVGGFPEIALMEDVAMSRKLKRHGRPVCLRRQVVTSSRRWCEHGVLRTVLLMWRLRLSYAFGADPAVLAQIYHRG